LAEFFDSYAPIVNRLVWQFLGPDEDHDDVVQQVLMNALRWLHKIRDPGAIPAWVTTVTLNTIRTELRRRRARRWLRFVDPNDSPEQEHHDDHGARAALRRAYTLLAKLPADEHLAFVLRHLEDQPLDTCAAACGWSLATFKRKLKAADERVARLAANEPLLAEYLLNAQGREP